MQDQQPFEHGGDAAAASSLRAALARDDVGAYQAAMADLARATVSGAAAPSADDVATALARSSLASIARGALAGDA